MEGILNIASLPEVVFDKGVDIAIALLIVLFSALLLKVVTGWIKRAGKSTNMQRHSIKTANWVASLIVYSLALVWILYVLGYNVTALAAGVGIFALAIGFAAQQLLANIIAGFLIIIEKPFRIGDRVAYEDVEGWVENIGLRSTRINTPDNNTVIVPNSNLVNSTVINQTNGQKKMVVSVKVVVQKGENLKKRVEIAEKIAKKIDYALVDEKHKVRVDVKPVEKIGQTRYIVETLFWVKDTHNARDAITQFSLEMNKKVKTA